MNINEEIQKVTDQFITEKLPELLGKKVEKMLDELLTDMFKSYGDIGKDVQQKIQKNLNINLERVNMVDYNHLIANAIANRLGELVNENSVEPIIKMVDEIVGFIEKKKINLSEIHTFFYERMVENAFSSGGEFTFLVQHHFERKWYSIGIDQDKNKDIDSCDIQFSINESGRIFLFKSGNYWNKPKMVTPASIVMMDRVQRQIYRLYCAQVEIVVDETHFDNHYSLSED
jgi:hypothetical protein